MSEYVGKINQVNNSGEMTTLYPVTKSSAIEIDTMKQFVDFFYPVGSIIQFVNDIDPNLKFGGSWKKIEGQFLLGSSSAHALESTGGDEDAVVVSHSHDTTVSSNSHEHSINYAKTGASGSSRNVPYTPKDATTSNWINSYTHSHSVTVKSEGVSGVGKNMPPYVTVNIWKREA